MEENETKSCPVKSFFCSKPVLIVLACLACFFIGYFAGSKTSKVPQARLARPAGMLPSRQFNARPVPPRVNVNTPRLPQRPVINPNVKPIPNMQNVRPNAASAQQQPRINTIKAQQTAAASQSTAAIAPKTTPTKNATSKK